MPIANMTMRGTAMCLCGARSIAMDSWLDDRSASHLPYGLQTLLTLLYHLDADADRIPVDDKRICSGVDHAAGRAPRSCSSLHGKIQETAVKNSGDGNIGDSFLLPTIESEKPPVVVSAHKLQFLILHRGIHSTALYSLPSMMASTTFFSPRHSRTRSPRWDR